MRDLTWVLERKTLTEDRWAAWAKLSEFTLLTKLCDSFWSRHSKASFFVERSYQRWKRYGLEVHVDLYVVIRRPTTSTISFDKNLLVVGNQGDQMFYTQCESFKPKSGLPPIKAYHKLKSCDSCNLPLRTVNTSKIFWKYNFLKCRIEIDLTNMRASLWWHRWTFAGDLKFHFDISKRLIDQFVYPEKCYLKVVNIGHDYYQFHKWSV